MKTPHRTPLSHIRNFCRPAVTVRTVACDRESGLLDLEDLRKVRKVVLVSGGPYKAEIIRAVLLRNVVHELVIDESAARQLLEQDN